MFDKDTYIARPPAIIDPRERLCLEAIALSIGMIMNAIKNVQATAIRHKIVPPDIVDFSEDDKLNMCSALWSIVDQTHMLISLIKTLKFRSPTIDCFIAAYDSVSRMRNKMDHLHTTLPLLVETKKNRPTIFGTLSYLQYNNAADPNRGFIISVVFGNLMDKRQNFPLVNPVGKPLADGASLFMFSAFDDTLNIAQLRDDIPQLAKHLESVVRSAVSAHIEQIKSEGKPTDGLLEQGTSVIAVASIQFDFATGAAPEGPPSDRATPLVTDSHGEKSILVAVGSHRAKSQRRGAKIGSYDIRTVDDTQTNKVWPKSPLCRFRPPWLAVYAGSLSSDLTAGIEPASDERFGTAEGISRALGENPAGAHDIDVVGRGFADTDLARPPSAFSGDGASAPRNRLAS